MALRVEHMGTNIPPEYVLFYRMSLDGTKVLGYISPGTNLKGEPLQLIELRPEDLIGSDYARVIIGVFGSGKGGMVEINAPVTGDMTKLSDVGGVGTSLTIAKWRYVFCAAAR